MTEWKLVPVEPTEAMWKAADKQSEFCAIHNYGASPSAEDYWHAMLDAAPALENGPAVLADAPSKSPDPSLSSLRKGAEVAALDVATRALNRIASRQESHPVSAAFSAMTEIRALVSGSREDGA